MGCEAADDFIALLRSQKVAVERTELECRFHPPDRFLWTRIAAECACAGESFRVDVSRKYAGVPVSDECARARAQLHQQNSHVSCTVRGTARRLHAQVVGAVRAWMQYRASLQAEEWSHFVPAPPAEVEERTFQLPI